MRIEPFTVDKSEIWDQFVSTAWNGTLMHTRRYLSYHGERFNDQSLMVTDQQGTVLGLLPAAVSPDDERCIYSHPGITFGGIVCGNALLGPAMVEALELIKQHFASAGYRRLIYKTVPHIYHQTPCEDDRYALFRSDAMLTRCDLWSVVQLLAPSGLTSKARRKLNRALTAGITLKRGRPLLIDVWALLNTHLDQHYNAAPVHTLSEIQMLFDRFPDQLECWAAYLGDTIVAAVVTYDMGSVRRFQYNTSNEDGRSVNAPLWLFDHVINDARQQGYKWVDFGSSNASEGREINEGLHRFKKQLGASGVVHEYFDVPL